MRAFAAARAELAAKPSRIVATVLAVLIGVGFGCAALVFTSTFQADFGHRLSVEYSGADFVIEQAGDDPAADTARDIAAVDGVADVEPLYSATLDYTSAKSHGYLWLKLAARDGALRWATLVDGDWPAGANEVAITQPTSVAASLAIGDTMTITGSLTATVVGVVDASAAPFAGGDMVAFASAAAFGALGVNFAQQIAVRTDPGADAGQVGAAIEANAPGVTVRTVAEQAAHDVSAFTGQTSALTTVLLGFAAIALVVAAIVIANTFTMLLAARRRQIGLLRCIGAQARQVRSQVLLEAAIVGAAGSVLGAVLGAAVGAVAAAMAGLNSAGVTVPALPIVGAMAVGVAITVGAAALPVRRAMKTSPLTALRPVSDAQSERRAGRVRLALGLGLVLLGGAGLGYGVYAASLPAGMLGGAISAVGVLLLTRSFLPPLLRAIGRVARLGGVPGRLAAVNAVRNPGRAAATSAALVVGVGLIVMLQVAAASVGASIDRATADRYPVDMVVAGDGTPMPQAVIGGIERTDGLAATLPIHGAMVRVSASAVAGETGGEAGGEAARDAGAEAAGEVDLTAEPLALLGVPATASEVARGGLSTLAPETDGTPTVLVPTWWVASGQVAIGDPLILNLDGRQEVFTVAVGRLTEAGVTNGDSLVTTAAALDRLAPHAPVLVLWGALGAEANPASVFASLNTLVADSPGIFVNGAVAERGSMQQILGTVTTVATGLLAVAVLIAIIGIGNTIGLSVAERIRESALLRALGLQRRQLRWMLAVEALLLATVGAAVGLVIGLVYGWAGAATTFGDIGRTLVLAVPWGSIATVLVVAIAAGVLASVLPARRAARVAPAEALAEE